MKNIKNKIISRKYIFPCPPVYSIMALKREDQFKTLENLLTKVLSSLNKFNCFNLFNLLVGFFVYFRKWTDRLWEDYNVV